MLPGGFWRIVPWTHWTNTSCLFAKKILNKKSTFPTKYMVFVDFFSLIYYYNNDVNNRVGFKSFNCDKTTGGQNGRCFAGQILVRHKPFRKRKSVFVNFYTGET